MHSNFRYKSTAASIITIRAQVSRKVDLFTFKSIYDWKHRQSNGNRDLNQLRKISEATWFHRDRRATSAWNKERRWTQGHEIQHHGCNTGFPILPVTTPPPPPPPQPPQPTCLHPFFPFNPSTVLKRRGRADMKALICWPLCSELLGPCAWRCSSPATPHTCCC